MDRGAPARGTRPPRPLYARRPVARPRAIASARTLNALARPHLHFPHPHKLEERKLARFVPAPFLLDVDHTELIVGHTARIARSPCEGGFRAPVCVDGCKCREKAN